MRECYGPLQRVLEELDELRLAWGERQPRGEVGRLRVRRGILRRVARHRRGRRDVDVCRRCRGLVR